MAVLYDGRQDQRKAIWKEYSGEGKFNVMITHYDLIMRDKAYLKKVHWYYMIVDEGHRLKNYDCSLAQTIRGYVIMKKLLTVFFCYICSCIHACACHTAG